MMTSGALSAEIEPVPRTRIEGETPTSEVTLLMLRPEICPCNAVVMSETGRSLSTSPPILEMAPVRCDFIWVP